MTAEQLTAIAGIALSLIFAYLPGVATWYNPLAETSKKLIMLGVLAATALIIFGLSCGNVITAVSCTAESAKTLLTAFIYALIANQGTNAILPRIGLKTPTARPAEISMANGASEAVTIQEKPSVKPTTTEPPTQ